MAQVANRPQFLDHHLEWSVLMRVGPQRRLPHPAQQLTERGIAGAVGPDHERVEEETNQVGGLGPIAGGDW